jgi:hypothetical protein
MNAFLETLQGMSANSDTYMRHAGYRLRSHASDDSQLFRDDASFNMR